MPTRSVGNVAFHMAARLTWTPLCAVNFTIDTVIKIWHLFLKVPLSFYTNTCMRTCLQEVRLPWQRRFVWNVKFSYEISGLYRNRKRGRRDCYVCEFLGLCVCVFRFLCVCFKVFMCVLRLDWWRWWGVDLCADDGCKFNLLWWRRKVDFNYLIIYKICKCLITYNLIK